MVDTRDLKSLGHYGCAGSSPASGTVGGELSHKLTQLPFSIIIMKAVVNKEYESLTEYIKSIPAIFESTGTEIYHKRNIVKILRHDDMDLVVKRYKRPNLIQRIAYTFFCKGKAKRAYLFAGRMLDLGISTPFPIAFIEITKSGLLSDSYFISSRTFDRSLFPELVETPDYDIELASEVARLMVRLHEKGVIHGDPNLSNILYHSDAEGKTHFTLIDINRTRFGSEFTERECLANLMRLTHRRDLLKRLVSVYAEERKWDVPETVEKVFAMISRFEHRREIKTGFKRLLSPLKRK